MSAMLYLDINGYLGPPLIGAIVGTYLFGILTMQTFNYYNWYQRDSVGMKSLVAGTLVLELGHTITLWHALYLIFIKYQSSLLHLVIHPPHSLEITVLFATITNLIVQTFFVLRIHTLSNSWIIPIIVWALTLIRLAFDLLMFILFWETDGFEVFVSRVHWAMVTVCVCGPVVDLIIAGSLCYWLWRKRTETGFSQTRKMVDTLITWCVETTAITFAVGILQLILFLARSDIAWLTLFLVQPKVFSNTMLAHLNGRDRLRNQGGTHVSGNTSAPPMKGMSGNLSSGAGPATKPGTGVETSAELQFRAGGARPTTTVSTMSTGGETDFVKTQTEGV
ncbi:Saposin B-type domain-containing protein [Mycena chlorophos]|uniref:Saposin B-type domain-containing protein n=1 Tax=Mycena chlorophos TaxID=658473 RepID=A0A8H6VW98_MYCCL|nr:Saposin B-type domain-containing protein [Mycena chlorophos]